MRHFPGSLLLLVLFWTRSLRVRGVSPCAALNGLWFGGMLGSDGELASEEGNTYFSIHDGFFNVSKSARSKPFFVGRIAKCTAPSPKLGFEDEDAPSDPAMFGSLDLLAANEVVPFTMPCIWRWVSEDFMVAKSACFFTSDPSSAAKRPDSFRTTPPQTRSWAMLRESAEEAAEYLSLAAKGENASDSDGKANEDDAVAEWKKASANDAWLSDEVEIVERWDGEPRTLVTLSGRPLPTTASMSTDGRSKPSFVSDGAALDNDCLIRLSPFFNGAGDNNTLSLFREPVNANSSLENGGPRATTDGVHHLNFSSSGTRPTQTMSSSRRLSLPSVTLDMCALAVEDDPMGAVYNMLARAARHMPESYSPDAWSGGGSVWDIARGERVVSIDQLGALGDQVGIMLVPRTQPFIWPGYRLNFTRTLHNVERPEPGGNAVTLTTISMRPRAFRVGNLLSDREIDVVRASAEAKGMGGSTVVGLVGPMYNPSRTSSLTWLKYGNMAEVLDAHVALSSSDNMTALLALTGKGAMEVEREVALLHPYFWRHHHRDHLRGTSPLRIHSAGSVLSAVSDRQAPWLALTCESDGIAVYDNPTFSGRLAPVVLCGLLGQTPNEGATVLARVLESREVADAIEGKGENETWLRLDLFSFASATGFRAMFDPKREHWVCVSEVEREARLARGSGVVDVGAIFEHLYVAATVRRIYARIWQVLRVEGYMKGVVDPVCEQQDRDIRSAASKRSNDWTIAREARNERILKTIVERRLAENPCDDRSRMKRALEAALAAGKGEITSVEISAEGIDAGAFNSRPL